MDEKITLPLEHVRGMRTDRDNLIRLLTLSESLVGAAANIVADFTEELPYIPEPNKTLAVERLQMLNALAQQTETLIAEILKRDDR